MSQFKLSRRSLSRLKGLHPDLVEVVKHAITITTVDFTVLEGLRSRERQKRLVESGASRTMRSRHLTGHAVDLGVYLDGQVSWDWPLYRQLARCMARAFKDCHVPYRWGGTWEERVTGALHPRFADGPHWELPRGAYPERDTPNHKLPTPR